MQSYHGLAREFAGHDTVDHSAGEYVRGIVHVNFSESYFSLFKRDIIGAFRHISRKHIQRYLEEFDFRWNRRKISDSERMLAAVAGTEGKRLFYRAPKVAPDVDRLIQDDDVDTKRTGEGEAVQLLLPILEIERWQRKTRKPKKQRRRRRKPPAGER